MQSIFDWLLLSSIEDWWPNVISLSLITISLFTILKTIFTVFGNLLKRRCSLKIILKFSGMVYDSVFKVQFCCCFFFSVTACTVYHIKKLLSTTFLNYFFLFFSAVLFVPDSLDIITLLPNLVNYFFVFFFKKIFS